MIELLTPEEMAAADRATIAAGTPGIVLMERAGRAVADVARSLWRGGPILVLAGPGNNGGDGFVAARLLRDRGFRVTVLLLGEREALKGDAAEAAARFSGFVLPADLSLGQPKRGYITDPDELIAWARDLRPRERPGLIIDALYGAGVRLPLPAKTRELIRAINYEVAFESAWMPPQQKTLVLAVDLPSGVDGATGGISDEAIRADATVTFHRLKPGHLLLPGRTLCGAVTLADIGIPDMASIQDTVHASTDRGGGPRIYQIANGGSDRVRGGGPKTFVNRPVLWRRALPQPEAEGHKYTRGHALVLSGGPDATGAARLAASAALRIGAGLVTLASPHEALAINAAHLTSVMVKAMEGVAGFRHLLEDRRRNTVVLGPGLGVGEETARLVEVALRSGRAIVLDADALTSFEGDTRRLLSAVQAATGPVVVTPHDGEFARLVPDILGSRLERARAAAKRSGAIVLLKGPDTVVAHPDGRASIADNAPAALATAGSGDVLAGIVGGLLTQGMPPFEAASAAVWLHGEAAATIGAGLIAEDLPSALPGVLQRIG